MNQWMNLSFDLFLFLREVWSEKWNNKNTSARHLLFAQVKLPGTEYPCAPWISPLTLVSRNASKTIWLIRVIQFSLHSNIFKVTIQPTFPITSNHQSNSEKSYHEPPTPMQEQLEQFAPAALGHERPPPFPGFVEQLGSWLQVDTAVGLAMRYATFSLGAWIQQSKDTNRNAKNCFWSNAKWYAVHKTSLKTYSGTHMEKWECNKISFEWLPIILGHLSCFCWGFLACFWGGNDYHDY